MVAGMADAAKLTGQQEKFALGVASGKTQADAYREAYPRSKKWKDSAVYSQASALMADSKVSTRVKELKERITNAGIASAERVLLEASRLALFDPRKLFREDGSPKPINELDDDTAAALAGLDVLEEFEGSGDERVFVGYTKKYKIADKNSALEKLFKHHGLYEKDNEQKTDPLVELLRGMAGSPLPVVKGNGK
jgi:phage terminase small subunit